MPVSDVPIQTSTPTSSHTQTRLLELIVTVRNMWRGSQCSKDVFMHTIEVGLLQPVSIVAGDSICKGDLVCGGHIEGHSDLFSCRVFTPEILTVQTDTLKYMKRVAM